jgi:5-methylcytosine-specific restriction endonuclease McrA
MVRCEVKKKREVTDKDREYSRAYYWKNREVIREKARLKRLADPETERKYLRAYYQKNKQKRRDSFKRSYNKNKAYYTFKCRERGQNLAKNQTPPWLSQAQKAEIKEWYNLARELSWLSEEPLQVDHIVPLKGLNVSGLHVPWNLQILPRSLNRAKGNKHE